MQKPTAELTIQPAAVTTRAADSGSMAAARTANAANGVAQANAKLASTQPTVNRAKQNTGARRGDTGVNRFNLPTGRRRTSKAIVDLLCCNVSTFEGGNDAPLRNCGSGRAGMVAHRIVRQPI